MSHHHHDHDDHHHDHHDHKHHHHGEHHHHHESDGNLSFGQKMEKLLEHWLKHNSDHIGTYRQWAQKAKENGLNDISALLEDIASASLSLNDKFEEAGKLLKKDRS